MNTFELKIWDDERLRCTFYTVLQEGAEENETDRFFSKYETDPNPHIVEAVNELLSFVLLSIGDDHGARDEFFNRHENEVKGLPSKGKVLTYHFPNFPLRLYALKISEEIVVLFNGGLKNGKTNQESSSHLQWMEACLFARKINEAIKEKEIFIDGKQRKITNCFGGDEIIL